MLTIKITDECWDDETEKFTYPVLFVLEFEHSLVSLSKWEARFHKLFLVPDKKTEEEMLGYIEAMLMTPDLPPNVLNLLEADHLDQLEQYINDPMTGSTIKELPQNRSRTSERISSELIYYWMSQFNIPKECEHWHLNRLFTLIKIHNAKQQKPAKQSKQSRAQEMAELNAQRKAKLGTKG